MTTTINITWHQPDERSQGREDSVWYSHSADHHDIIATVSNGERSIHIYADGEVRVHLAYDPADWKKGHDVIRYYDQWKQYGIKNDIDIFQMSENGSIEWINNSWFDLYADNQGWADCVNHTLSDAILSATELLTDSEAWEE